MRHAVLILLLGFSNFAWSIERQLESNWCWAASVQTVVQQAGYYEPQFMVASRLTGAPINRPATIPEVVSLVQSYGLRSWAVDRPGNPSELYSTLLSGWKLIAFVRPQDGPIGHYIVLEGIDRFGNVVVSDPATGLSYPSGLNDLYYAWRWSGSVVVGR